MANATGTNSPMQLDTADVDHEIRFPSSLDFERVVNQYKQYAIDLFIPMDLRQKIIRTKCDSDWWIGLTATLMVMIRSTGRLYQHHQQNHMTRPLVSL